MSDDTAPSENQTLSIQQAIDLGVEHQNSGRLPEAERIYRKILQAEPDQPVALYLLGVIAYQVGDKDSAIDLISRALSIEPNYAEAHYHLGHIFGNTNNHREAAASYQKALAINPEYANAHHSLGKVLSKLDLWEEAVPMFEKAIALNPDNAEAVNDLGNALFKTHRFDESAERYQQAIDIKPDYAEAHYNLGKTFREISKPDEAITSYQNAIKFKPEFAVTYNNLGNVLKEKYRLDEAVSSYRKALTKNPRYAEALFNLGVVLQEQGNRDEAKKHFEMALLLRPEKDGWRLRKDLLLPVIPNSLEQIRSSRETLTKAISDLQNRPLVVEDPTVDVGATNFYLAYHSQNNKDLLSDIAQLHLLSCPKLDFVAPHCRSPRKNQTRRLRVGVLSAYLKDHTVGKLFRGLVEHLSKEPFEVIVFRLPGSADEMSEAFNQAANQVVRLDQNLERDQKKIAAQELDILLYLEIGMDPYTYFLSFARLAPVQVVSIGHAESSGVPSIDYFLSSDLTEPANADQHYSEHLIKLSYLPTYYYRPEQPTAPASRADFGLPDNCRLYVYPQTLFKLHPGLDTTLGKLLRRDPDGRLIFIDDGIGGHWNQRIIKRFSQPFPDVIDRIIFLPKMSYQKFLRLLLVADAILDNPFLSGTNSGLEAFGVGAPVVAWPGKYCSGNCVTACYRQMGLSDMIATDEETYVQLALRLAQDKGFQLRMQNAIKANSHNLFERIEVIREIEAFFLQAYEAWQKNDVLTNTKFKKPIATIRAL